MLQKFVILKGVFGEPLKRVFLTAEENEIVIGDPDRFHEIESGYEALSCVAYERVFNFDEDVYEQLLLEWQSSKETSADVWMRLGHMDVSSAADESSCPFWC